MRAWGARGWHGTDGSTVLRHSPLFRPKYARSAEGCIHHALQDTLLALLAGFAPRHAVRSVEPGVPAFMATALRSHMAGLLGRLAAAARHRAATAKRPANAVAGRDLRREVLAIERRERLAAEE